MTFGRMVEGPDDDQLPRGEDAGLPALPRAPQAPPLRGHGAGEVRRLLAVRGGLPGGLHPRGGGREHAGEPRQRRGALRRGVRDQPVALHLLWLLRDRVSVRRDHDGPRLRDGGLQPVRPDLHQGDAARRTAGAHAVAHRRTSSLARRYGRGLLLPRRDRRRRRCRGHGDAARRVLQRALARLAPDLPGDAVPAAARGVRRRGAGDRLRGRRDGALRLRRRLRRRHGGRAGRPERAAACGSCPCCSRSRCSSSWRSR